MSKEEQLLREQRKKIIEDINEYLNDQYNEPRIAPIPYDDEDEEDEEDDIPIKNEEEKVNENDDPVAPQKATKKK